MYAQQEKLLSAALIAVVLLLIAAFISLVFRRDRPFKGSCAGGGCKNTRRGAAVQRDKWVGGQGPYNLQLYDAPQYYPYYESRDVMGTWDNEGRCVSYCRASDDGGCAVVCR